MLGKLSDDSTISEDIKSLSNVFYDTFNEVKEYYSRKYDVETWEETATISIANTGSEVGLFDKSDVIAVYDIETHTPSIVTERIYRKNYTRKEWWRMNRYLKNKIKIIRSELGFNIRLSFSKDYIDYVHYKEEWWQWAMRQHQNSSSES